ncbi:MAG: glycosyltransferase family 4 protein [Ferruginibacter sp.]
MKKTIVHCIYNLGRGGAETMLVGVLKELKDYNNIVVTLFDDNRFGEKLECDKYICLNLRSLYSLPLAAGKLKNIIKENKAAIVHSHLFWPTLLARYATPKSIPLITTIHTSIASSNDYRKWHTRWLDKLSYRSRPSTIIAVSDAVLQDYFSLLKLKPGKHYVLHTFAGDSGIQQKISWTAGPTFKFISTGALRKQKNYAFLIDAFSMLKLQPVELHIYGSGPQQNVLEDLIESKTVKVFLMGEVENVYEILAGYDGYISASELEGFSLSILEAMAAKLPLLLSDIPSFREQCDNSAIYFDLNDNQALVTKIKSFVINRERREIKAEQAFRRFNENYTLPQHVKALREIYADAIKGI